MSPYLEAITRAMPDYVTARGRTVMTNPDKVMGRLRVDGREKSKRKIPRYLQEMAKDKSSRGQQLYSYELARLGLEDAQ